MICSIKFNTVKSGFIFCIIWGVMGYNLKKYIFLSLKIDFVFANNENLDEMPHYAAFHLGLYCLSKYPLKGFWYSRGIKHPMLTYPAGLEV